MGIVLLLLIAACVLVAIHGLNPPDAGPAATPLREFSSARAMQHLRVLAQTPRPRSSPGHTAARDYILHELRRLGLNPELQDTPAISNVLVRLAGAGQSEKAVLLVGHYDTVLDSPGAGDDGSAVAALLETLRALKAGAPLRNDVIVLFSDGEEDGLLGAKAFAYAHPWAKDVGLALNFDARGNGGPALMYETSSDNGRLVREFVRAAPHPVANSLAPELYKLMPNSTDLTVFKDVGWAGLNFAFFEGGTTHYHAPLDNAAEIDERSVQHQGTYALALAHHFGNLPLDNLRAPDVVYFNVFGSRPVVYSARWNLPLAVLLTLLLAGLVVRGWRARRLSLAEVGEGFAAVPLGMLITWFGVSLVGWLAGGLRGSSTSTNSSLAILALSAVAVAAAFYTWCGNKVGGANLLAGGPLWWLLLLLLTSVFWPGASYLFAWPLSFGLLALGLDLGATEAQPLTAVRLLTLVLCVLAGGALLAPAVYLIFIAFSLQSADAMFVLAASGALVLILLAPYFACLSAAPAQLTLKLSR